MTLTEQWKNGELENGYYFFKTKDNIKIGFLYEGFKHPYDGRYNTIDNAEEVLAPVPSYEEWQQMKAFCEEFNALDVAKENQQLKELVKECKYMILAYSINHDTFTKEKVLDTVKQITNAIGEKK